MPPSLKAGNRSKMSETDFDCGWPVTPSIDWQRGGGRERERERERVKYKKFEKDTIFFVIWILFCTFFANTDDFYDDCICDVFDWNCYLYSYIWKKR